MKKEGGSTGPAESTVEGRSYWAMRTDRANRALILDELRQGRLRQGWGWLPEQDLRVIAKKREQGQDLTAGEQQAWRNWPMLGGLRGIKPGDFVLLPNLPSDGRFVLVVVEGEYRYEPLSLSKSQDPNHLRQDYGHVLPIVRSEDLRPITAQDDRVDARLRGSLTCRSRLWSMAPHRKAIEDLRAMLEGEDFEKVKWDLAQAFQRVVKSVNEAIAPRIAEGLERQLTKAFSRQDLEIPCQELLKRIYPEAEVIRSGGPGEHGADLVVTWIDPLSKSGRSSDASWRIVAQVKDWGGEACDETGIDQLREAIDHWNEYPIRVAYILTRCDGESGAFKARREHLSKELGVQIEFMDRAELMSLFVWYFGPGSTIERE